MWERFNGSSHCMQPITSQLSSNVLVQGPSKNSLVYLNRAGTKKPRKVKIKRRKFKKVKHKKFHSEKLKNNIEKNKNMGFMALTGHGRPCLTKLCLRC